MKGTMQVEIEVKLTVHHGMLHVPFESIADKLQKEWADKMGDIGGTKDHCLIQVYDEGDCDTIPWPRRHSKAWNHRLAAALYDAREMGVIPDVRTVTLPDGKPFTIDSNME